MTTAAEAALAVEKAYADGLTEFLYPAFTKMETDPNGTDAHTPGAKLPVWVCALAWVALCACLWLALALGLDYAFLDAMARM